MKYLSVEFRVSQCDPNADLSVAEDLVVSFAAEAGCEAFEGLEAFAQVDLFEQAVLDEALADFPLENVEVSYEVSEVAEEVYYSQQATFQLAGDRGEIFIEAENAFGTGEHETTSMVLAELCELNLQNQRVLDCGCGTGILSIAASKLGANEVVGYDIDEWSVKNTEHNAMLNGVQVNALLGDSSILNSVEGQFEVVVANINRNILLNDMPRFCEKLHKTLILSGFYEADCDMLVAKAMSLGLKEIKRVCNNDWCCLVLEKP